MFAARLVITILFSLLLAFTLPVQALKSSQDAEMDSLADWVHIYSSQAIRGLEKPSEPEKPKELTRSELIKENPKSCTSDQLILWPDGKCSDKISTPAPVAQTVSGDWVAQCHAWAAQAGVSLPEAAITLISRESKCNPSVHNPTSSAAGIPQALPWTKMGCDLTEADAPCQIKWMQNYVNNRYGSWEAALAHSYSVGWY